MQPFEEECVLVASNTSEDEGGLQGRPDKFRRELGKKLGARMDTALRTFKQELGVLSASRAAVEATLAMFRTGLAHKADAAEVASLYKSVEDIRSTATQFRADQAHKTDALTMDAALATLNADINQKADAADVARLCAAVEDIRNTATQLRADFARKADARNMDAALAALSADINHKAEASDLLREVETLRTRNRVLWILQLAMAIFMAVTHAVGWSDVRTLDGRILFVEASRGVVETPSRAASWGESVSQRQLPAHQEHRIGKNHTGLELMTTPSPLQAVGKQAPTGVHAELVGGSGGTQRGGDFGFLDFMEELVVSLENLDTPDWAAITSVVDIQMSWTDGWTLLHCAAERGAIRVARALLSSSLDVNAMGDCMTALHVAIVSNNEDLASELVADSRVDIHAKTCAGKTAFSLAVEVGSLKVLDALFSQPQLVKPDGLPNFIMVPRR